MSDHCKNGLLFLIPVPLIVLEPVPGCIHFFFFQTDFQQPCETVGEKTWSTNNALPAMQMSSTRKKSALIGFFTDWAMFFLIKNFFYSAHLPILQPDLYAVGMSG